MSKWTGNSSDQFKVKDYIGSQQHSSLTQLTTEHNYAESQYLPSSKILGLEIDKIYVCYKWKTKNLICKGGII